ncbi:class I SAM-dependent methyltransferase [Polynucleobacter paneuropaeus]|nr:class I SAM-dependent methyltransferase [Polynucleobacter paneuropaeus]
MKNSLDLGCGENPRNPFEAPNIFGVDVRDLNDNRIKIANLFLEPIPFDAEFFDFVTAFDFIEHVPRVLCIFNPISGLNEIKNPFIEIMNEIYRVLKMGGLFYSHTPALPNPAAFQDPTHVNFITEQTFPLYFNDHYPVGHMYGFNGGFRILEQKWDGEHLVTAMVKSPRPNLEKFKKK